MEGAVADDADARVGALLEQLGARFELVLEAVTGFGGRLDALREEMVGQFTEVGRQIRFLSDRIAENRTASAANRADLGAEMVRLGEMVGATRVEFREQLASTRSQFEQGVEAAAKRAREYLHDEVAAAAGELRAQVTHEIAALGETTRGAITTAGEKLGREFPLAAATVREQISSSSDSLVKHLDIELKHTNKTLGSLARKFERFDDRITVQTKDHDQRLRKLEQRRASR
jgi:F0F1-type ATP synthase membrane subunit b/b'